MSDNATNAAEFKAQGNAALAKGEFEEAVKCYTQAIEADDSNHVFFSNRSAAYASLNKFEEALADGQKTIDLNPSFIKGYSRKGLALFRLERLEEAQQAYEDGLKIDPENVTLKQGIEEVMGAGRSKGLGQMGALFGNRQMIDAALARPECAAFKDDASLQVIIAQIHANPNLLMSHLGDERIMTLFTCIMSLMTGTGDPMAQPPQQEKPKEAPKPAPKAKEPEPEVPEHLKKALEHKANGNAAYKARNFDEAIEHYTKAMEADPTCMVYQTNRAAAYFEKKDYDQTIKECREAIEIGRASRTDYAVVAKAFTRIGNAYMRQEKFGDAVEAFQKSLTENRAPAVLKLLKVAQKAKEDQDKREYLSPEIAQEEKTKGNDAFRKGDYPTAVKHYSEAIKRSPEDPVMYSNRAAAYTKLMALPSGLKDCEKALELDPTFVKAYSRKGHIQFFCKEYTKAMNTYQKGLKLDPENQELRTGLQRVYSTMQQQAATGEVDPEVTERAMQDPEIQAILQDPVINEVLRALKEDPRGAQHHLKDPNVAAKINTLISVGIIKTR
eukprot:TRINITY_DN2108_c1_g1_i1.p1 TRINITY_DN2108_c1_g1~~TRINITY_DN2108_c1_g1_i1.p1  ORF type:complete len:555 (-),score=195.52 TRINITY_DN2108_c1_g1_i1:1320-2984(-)